MKFFLFIFLVTIFIPLPIKLSIYVSTKNYYVKIYRFYILKKDKLNNEKTKSSEIKKPYKRNLKRKPSLFKGFSPKKIIKLINLLNKNKFKPVLRMKGYFAYSLGDAAKTAIFYGILSTYFPLLLFALNIVFKTKNLSLPIRPIYEDKIIAETEITSIITLSLVQIISMSVLLIKAIHILKEVKLERENI